jgi:hypothetical protein
MSEIPEPALKTEILGWVCGHTPIISALRRLWQEDCQFEANLCDTGKHCVKKQKAIGLECSLVVECLPSICETLGPTPLMQK